MCCTCPRRNGRHDITHAQPARCTTYMAHKHAHDVSHSLAIFPLRRPEEYARGPARRFKNLSHGYPK